MPNGLVPRKRKVTKTVFASAARTTAPTDVDLDTSRYKALVLNIHCSADPSTASVTFEIIAVDPLSGEETQLLQSAALDAADEKLRLTVSPDVADSANVAANAELGELTRIQATPADTESITYSVSVELIPYG